MRAFFRFTALNLLLSGGGALVACGGATTQQPPTVPAEPAPSESAPASVEAVSLTPVAAPSDLIVQGRFKDPAQVLNRGADWMHIPFSWEELLASQAPDLANIIDLSAPADISVTLDPESFGNPKVLFGVAVGLKSFDQALQALRSAGRQVDRVSSQMHFVRLEQGPSCVVARSVGKTPARLICSEDRKSLDALAPYMSRTLPAADLGPADVRVTFSAEPIRKRYGKKAHLLKVGIPVFLREASLNNRRFDSALSDASHGVVDELLRLSEELDQLELNAWMHADREVLETEFKIKFRGSRSFITGELARAAAVAGPAPALFWQLPAEVDGASYGHISPLGDRYDNIQNVLSELALGGAEHLGMPDSSLKAWLASLEKVWGLQGTTVYAWGSLPDGPAQAKPKGEPTEGEKLRALLGDRLGYQFYALQDDAGVLSDWVEKSVQLWNDGKLRAFAEKQAGETVKHLPLVKRTAGGKGLPKGSVTYSVSISEAMLNKLDESEKYKGLGAVVVSLLVVPEGGRTWIGVSTDEKVLLSKLQAAMKVGPNTLSAEAALEPLKTQRANSAGFFRLHGALGSLRDLAELTGGIDAEKVELAMPHRGRTPMRFRSVVSADGPTWSVSYELPKSAVEDLAAGIMSAVAQAGASAQ